MNLAELSATFTQAVGTQLQRLVAFLPNLGGALLLVLAGWVLARLARAVAGRIMVAALDRLSERPSVERGLDQGLLRSRIPLIVRFTAFWVVLVAFLAAAIEQLDIDALSSPLSALTFYAPRLLAALLIGVSGFIAGSMANQWTAAALSPLGAAQGQMLGRLAQFGTVAVALIMAADQAGIESTVLMVALGILLIVTLGGVALAFAIGCGPVVGNLVASHYIGKQLSKGQVVQVGEHRGAVREISAAFVILQTDEGEVVVPARKFLEEASVLTAGDKA